MKKNEIVMKYPLIAGNSLCDGRDHTISPTALSEFYVDGQRYLIMDYVDYAHNTDAYTVLEVNGGRYYKIPFESYDDFDVLYERYEPKPIGLNELSRVSYIQCKRPLRNVSSLGLGNQKKPENQKKPGRLAIQVFFDKDGNFYIIGGAAHLIFDRARDRFDIKPTYRLTAKQLKYLMENYFIVWSFLENKNEYNSINNINEFITNALKKLLGNNFYNERGLSNVVRNGIVPVHYVSLHCDDSLVHGGVLNLSHLQYGTREYVYDRDTNTYVILIGSQTSEYYDYLEEFVNVDETNDASKREEEIKDRSIPIDDIPDYVGNNAVYSFVGRWYDESIKIDSVTPLEIDGDLRKTLSSCLLGYIDSRCTGSYIDSQFYDEIHSDSINIKQRRNETSRKR